jgi:hypothetical protein
LKENEEDDDSPVLLLHSSVEVQFGCLLDSILITTTGAQRKPVKANDQIIIGGQLYRLYNDSYN